jgi:hypothetical protein
MYKTKADAERAYLGYLSKKTITGKLQEMAAEEIKEYIDKNKYEEIKKTDGEPLFRAYSIGHEGESSGNVIGVGGMVKKWLKSAIQKIHDKLKIGTKIFHGHVPETNEHEGRQQVGELVGKTIQKIKDKLHTLGIIYIDPEHRNKNLDIASIETEFAMDRATHEVVDIGDVTGIALGDSAKEKPGFPEATLQGALQEMAEKLVKEKKINRGVRSMDIDELKKEIKAGEYKPDDLFTRVDLDSVDFVKGYKQKGIRLDSELDKKQKVITGFDTERADWEKEKGTYAEKINGYKLNEKKRDAKTKLPEFLSDDGRKLSDAQKKFISHRFDNNFRPSDEDGMLNRDINKYIDNRLNEYDEMKKMDLIKEEEKKEEKKEGVPATDIPKDGLDLSDPNNNFLIPK